MFIKEAFAETATKMPSIEGIPQAIGNFIPLIIIFCVFYFMLIRPQAKKQKLHGEMLKSLKRGDRVTLSGGMLGTIHKIEEEKDLILVEIAPEVRVQVIRSAITDLFDKNVQPK